MRVYCSINAYAKRASHPRPSFPAPLCADVEEEKIRTLAEPRFVLQQQRLSAGGKLMACVVYTQTTRTSIYGNHCRIPPSWRIFFAFSVAAAATIEIWCAADRFFTQIFRLFLLSLACLLAWLMIWKKLRNLLCWRSAVCNMCLIAQTTIFSNNFYFEYRVVWIIGFLFYWTSKIDENFFSI